MNTLLFEVSRRVKDQLPPMSLRKPAETRRIAAPYVLMMITLTTKTISASLSPLLIATVKLAPLRTQELPRHT